MWTSVGFATDYHIQVATTPAFGTTDIVIDEIFDDIQGYIPFPGLENGTYYWRVKGTSSTVEGPWSAVGVFTII
jgi:hypothetical protein